MTTLHDFTVRGIGGEERALWDYAGKVLLVVNVASRCGLTPQYSALEELHRKYAPRGFSVLGFPCNDFAGQEPGTETEIAAFCAAKYDVTFPLFSKIKVLGAEKAPAYAFLTGAAAGPQDAGDVTWNFEKFVVDPSGQVVARFSPPTSPLDPEVAATIEGALPQ